MSTKLPTKRDVRFLLCEDIRQETLNKTSLLGLIPGEQFMVGGPRPPGMPPNIAFVLPSLGFMFVITGGSGRFPGRFKVIAPDKKTEIVDMPIEKPIDIAPGGRGAVFATGSKPFVGPAYGTYTVELDVGAAKFKFAMTIEQGPQSPESVIAALGKPRKSKR